MVDIENILEIAREVSGLDWQARPDTAIDPSTSDGYTIVILPVSHPTDIEDYVLLFLLTDPNGAEGEKIERRLLAWTVTHYLDALAMMGEHDA